MQARKLEVIGQMTAGIAHDLNNLLMPMLGTLDMLRHRAAGQDLALIDGALQTGERARKLVQRLLSLSRHQPVRTEPVDLGALLGGMMDLLVSVTEPAVALHLEVMDGLPSVNADSAQLEMAVLNLVLNARDAMPGGGRLTISASRSSIRFDDVPNLQPGHYVCLSFVDTGTGMDAPTLARATKPFFTTKEPGQGTGLGLSTAHDLARELGGELMLDSRPNGGTTVRIWLPIRCGMPAEVAPAAGDRRIEGLARTALLVDDQEVVRATVAGMLADLGFSVVEAGSAEAALSLLGSGLKADLLITDYCMPGLNGAELTEVLHARAPDLPVLIVTGHDEPVEPTAKRRCLLKPFRQGELEAALLLLMGDSKPVGHGSSRECCIGSSPT